MKKILKFGAILGAFALVLACLVSCKEDDMEDLFGGKLPSTMTVELKGTTEPYFGCVYVSGSNTIETQEKIKTVYMTGSLSDYEVYNYNKGNNCMLKFTISGTKLTLTVLRGGNGISSTKYIIYENGKEVGRISFFVDYGGGIYELKYRPNND